MVLVVLGKKHKIELSTDIIPSNLPVMKSLFALGLYDTINFSIRPRKRHYYTDGDYFVEELSDLTMEMVWAKHGKVYV